MLDIGWVEILFIMGLALLIFGPKELPVVLRTIGSFIGRLRNMLFAFEQQVKHQMHDVTDTLNVNEGSSIQNAEKKNESAKTKKRKAKK